MAVLMQVGSRTDPLIFCISSSDVVYFHAILGSDGDKRNERRVTSHQLHVGPWTWDTGVEVGCFAITVTSLLIRESRRTTGWTKFEFNFDKFCLCLVPPFIRHFDIDLQICLFPDDYFHLKIHLVFDLIISRLHSLVWSRLSWRNFRRKCMYLWHRVL